MGSRLLDHDRWLLHMFETLPCIPGYPPDARDAPSRGCAWVFVMLNALRFEHHTNIHSKTEITLWRVGPGCRAPLYLFFNT